MKRTSTALVAAASIALAAIAPAPARAEDGAPIIEVATFKLKEGVTREQFAAIDREVQTDYISKRPGFLSRESAPGSQQDWLVIVRWRSVADADASMKRFSTAPAAAKFMSMVVPGSMVMNRYGR